MQTTNEFLNAAKVKLHLPSDYALTKRLGLSENAVGNYRKGRTRLDDRVVIRLADILEVDPAYIMACVYAERAGDDETLRGVWATVAGKFARAEQKLQPYLKAAAAFLLMVLLSAFSGGPDGGAQAATRVNAASPSQVQTAGPVCIMSNGLRDLFAVLLEPARWLMCIFAPSSLAVA
jgi:transcriptional regulator with XRE-family HTH domain